MCVGNKRIGNIYEDWWKQFYVGIFSVSIEIGKINQGRIMDKGTQYSVKNRMHHCRGVVVNTPDLHFTGDPGSLHGDRWWLLWCSS